MGHPTIQIKPIMTLAKLLGPNNSGQIPGSSMVVAYRIGIPTGAGTKRYSCSGG